MAGEVPETDRRLTEIRHTDMHYSMPEYDSLDQWQERAAFLRKQILYSAGLAPLPEKTPLNARVFGKVKYGDYTIEKVLLETYPGSYLGGNLYRPRGGEGPFPGIVSPHGHWTYGRLENSERGSVPARGIHLAQQGHVVFTYDMVGYNDTIQFPHGFEDRRNQLWSIGVLGLQLWNSIRAVDFLASLPDVNPERIAATGASGGATQTFLLQAVDERIKFSAPVNMISAIMQGGSYCENAPNLRIGTNNMEIAALMAPRPMLMVSATGDWTRNTPEEEFPAVQSVYKLYKAPDNVETVQFDSPHNYHRGSREAVYRFFGRWILGDPKEEHFAEGAYHPEQLSYMLALWNLERPAGAIGLKDYVAARVREAERQTEKLRPANAAGLEEARAAFHERLSFATMASSPAADAVLSERVEKLPNGEKLVLGRRGEGDRVPAVLLQEKNKRNAPRPALIVHPEGSAWTLSSSESRNGIVKKLLREGGAVLGIDAFQTERIRVPRDIASAGQYAERFYTTFNRTNDARRVQDILTAIAFLRARSGEQNIHVAGFEEAGVWALFAAALAEGPLTVAADLHHFNAASGGDYLENFFIPHIRKAGDFRAAAPLLAGRRLLVHNLHESFPMEWYERSFAAAGAPKRFESVPHELTQEAVARWLLGEDLR